MESDLARRYRNLKEEFLYETIRVIDRNHTVIKKEKELEKERLLEIIYEMNDPDRRHIKVKKMKRLEFNPNDRGNIYQ